MATIWSADDVDFGNFNPVNADYGPRGIKAVAAMVNRQNIGQWALEFEHDLLQDEAGMPCFFITANRGEDDPIELKIEAGVWIIKVWGELHVFKDGMFQRTFDVPKEQLTAARKAFHQKEIAEEREYQREREEVRSAIEADFEAKLQRALDFNNWSELDASERHILMQRLKEDEKFKVFQVAAQLMMDAKKKALQEYAAKDVEVTQHLHIPISDLVEEIKKSGVPADYRAGSLYKSEGQEPGFYKEDLRETASEKTVFVPSAGELGKQMTDSVEKLYLEGQDPKIYETTLTEAGVSPAGDHTQIMSPVGELDTDDSNGRLE